MARSHEAPQTIGKVIDELERVREELFALQRSLEKIEGTNLAPHRKENGKFFKIVLPLK
jgi:hypothetical protein